MEFLRHGVMITKLRFILENAVFLWIVDSFPAISWSQFPPYYVNEMIKFSLFLNPPELNSLNHILL